MPKKIKSKMAQVQAMPFPFPPGNTNPEPEDMVEAVDSIIGYAQIMLGGNIATVVAALTAASLSYTQNIANLAGRGAISLSDQDLEGFEQLGADLATLVLARQDLLRGAGSADKGTVEEAPNTEPPALSGLLGPDGQPLQSTT